MNTNLSLFVIRQKKEEIFALQEYWQDIETYGKSFGWKDVE